MVNNPLSDMDNNQMLFGNAKVGKGERILN